MQTLRFRLLLLGTIPFLLMLVAGSVVYRSTVRDLVISEWRERVSEQVAFKRMIVDDWLRQRRESVLFLAGSSAWRSADSTVYTGRATSFLEVFEDFRAVVFASPEGTVLFDSSLPPPSIPAGASVSDRLYFQRALAGRTNVLDEPLSIRGGDSRGRNPEGNRNRHALSKRNRRAGHRERPPTPKSGLETRGRDTLNQGPCNLLHL